MTNIQYLLLLFGTHINKGAKMKIELKPNAKRTIVSKHYGCGKMCRHFIYMGTCTSIKWVIGYERANIVLGSSTKAKCHHLQTKCPFILVLHCIPACLVRMRIRVVFLLQINLYITRSCLFSFPSLSFFCCINNGTASKQMRPGVGGFLLSTPLYSHTWLMVGLFSPALLCSLLPDKFACYEVKSLFP